MTDKLIKKDVEEGENKCFVDKKDYERLMTQGKREDMERLFEYAVLKFKEERKREGIIKIGEEYANIVNEDITEDNKEDNEELIYEKDKITWIDNKELNSWEDIKIYSKKKWGNNESYWGVDPKWFFLAHSKDNIEGKPQLIEAVQK